MSYGERGHPCLVPPTLEEALTLLEAHSVRVALLRCCGVVALRHRHDGCSVPHQELTERKVVTGCCTVEGGPGTEQQQNYT